jgi:hypothetical protein
MTLKSYKRYAHWVLCAAIGFVAGNTAHAIEHSISVDSGQSYVECNHCSVEHSAAVGHAEPITFSSPSASCSELVFCAHVAAPVSNSKARAPPLS